MNYYKLFGEGPAELVIELGLGSCIEEWNPFIRKISENYSGLIYERAGINRSIPSLQERTPENIAKELYELLTKVNHTEKIILLAHSQGGLYAQQFTRMYPSLVKGLILLDPLSANDNKFREQLNDKEYKMSGVDKSKNFIIMEKMAKMKLGGIAKKMLRKAPPIYYYKDYSKEEIDCILGGCTNPVHAHNVIMEYRLAHEDRYIVNLKQKGEFGAIDTFPDIPLILITHDSKAAIEESMLFGHNTEEFAARVENMWQDIMKEYLTFSSQARWIQADGSTHYIHLQNPEVIIKALEGLNEQ